jgi:hypothetical protein
MWPTQAGTPPPAGNRKRRWLKTALRGYLILYVRSPSALLDDSIFSPPFLPRMLTKPRTVCACQPVAFMISANVAPLARFISAMTSAFLLPRSVVGLAVLLARPAFFAGLAFLAGVRFVFGRAVSGSRRCAVL